MFWTLWDEKRFMQHLFFLLKLTLPLIRLIELDNLHSRSREYHNNIHTFTTRVTDGYVNPSSDSNDAAFHYSIWSPHSSPRIHGVVKECDASIQLPLLKPPKSGVLWIHLEKVGNVVDVMKQFHLHDAFAIFFMDLRAHSSIVELPKGILLSLCTVHIDEERCLMHKMYAYTSHGLCITFEHELIPDLTMRVDSNQPIEYEGTSMSSFPNVSQRKSNVIYSRLCAIIPLVGIKLSTVGSGYLLFQLVMEMLSIQDPLLEFCSRSIFYHKNLLVGHKHLKKNTFIHRKVSGYTERFILCSEIVHIS